MGTREVAVSISGIVAGVIIGAGVASFASGVTLDASALGASALGTDIVAFRSLPEGAKLIKARDVDAVAQPPDRSRGMTVKEAVTETAAPVAQEKTTCDIVKEVVKEIATAHNRVIPRTIKNTEARQALDKALDAIVDKHCTDEASASSAAASTDKAEDVPVVNNGCARYQTNALRYTQCQIFEKQGKVYKGW